MSIINPKRLKVHAPVLDLEKCEFRHERGDIVVWGTWYREQRGMRPCLVLTPSVSSASYRVRPYVIPLDHAHLWAEETSDPRDIARMSYFAADALGLNKNNRDTCLRIVLTIQEHLSDLLAIPPFPEDRVVVADAIRRNADGKETNAEILDYAD